MAARHALERLAPREAVELLESGVGMLESLPAGDDRDAREFALLALLGPALLATRSWADEHAATVLQRTHALAQRLGDPQQIERSTFKLATFHEVRGAYAEAEALLQSVLDGPTGALGRGALVDTHELMACTLFHQAEFERALENAERGVEMSNGALAGPSGAAVGDSADVACHCWAGLSLWFLGRPDEALARAETAIAIARDAAHVHSEATAHGYAALVAQLRNEPARARELADRAIAHGIRAGYSYRTAHGRVVRGWARAAAGDAEGLSEVQDGIEVAETMGALMDRAYFLGLLAEVHLLRDEVDEAQAALDRAFAAMPERRFYYEAELHRLQGEVLCRAGERVEGRAALERAVELARAKASPALELRAGLALGAILREEGDGGTGRGARAPPVRDVQRGLRHARPARCCNVPRAPSPPPTEATARRGGRRGRGRSARRRRRERRRTRSRSARRRRRRTRHGAGRHRRTMRRSRRRRHRPATATC